MWIIFVPITFVICCIVGILACSDETDNSPASAAERRLFFIQNASQWGISPHDHAKITLLVNDKSIVVTRDMVAGAYRQMTMDM